MKISMIPRMPLLGCVLGAALLLISFFLLTHPPDQRVILQGQPPGQPPDQAVMQEPAEALAGQWGIQALGLRLAVGGNMLDFRYSVLDPNKAGWIQEQSRQAFLVDEVTGVRLPLENAARAGSNRRHSRELTEGSTYSLAFANPGRHFKAGSKVTVVMGDFRAENLLVQ